MVPVTRNPLSVAALSLLGVVGVVRVVAETPQPAAQGRVWFDELEGSLSLTDDDGMAIVNGIAAALANRAGEPGVLPSPMFPPSMFPPTLASDVRARIVLLSASDGTAPARVVVGSGRGLKAALGDVLVRARRRGIGGKTHRWLKVDIVKEAGRETVIGRDRRLYVEPFAEGIAFPHQRGLALLPEEVAVHGVVQGGRLAVRNLARALLIRRSRVDGPHVRLVQDGTKLRVFSVLSFFFDGRRAVRLRRGHRVREDLPAPALLESARQAGEYLRRSVLPDGRFVYSYHPDKNRVASAYNMVRHAGTIYSMLELYQVTRDSALLESAERALRFLVDSVVSFGTPDEKMTIIVDQGKIKLGGVALTLVALVEYEKATQAATHRPLMRELARYIVHSQLDDGRLISQRYYPSGTIRKDFVSEYYPGEAILGLLRLHSLDPQDLWLATAEKAARYLITGRDAGKSVPELSHDHWLLYALNELYRLRSEDLFLDHALRITQAITRAQNRSPPDPDWLGSYYVPPRSTPTAVRTEGLLAAYALTRDLGRHADASSILEAVKLGIGFQLQTQFQPEKVLYLEDPPRALGAFHHSLKNYEIRIDYVQHNISALLGYYRVLEGR